MDTPLLEAREITVEREGRRIVASASVTLGEAAIVTISGPSGCGKSTLLRAVATLIPRAAGTLRFEGHEVEATGVEASALVAYRRRVAYVPQLPRMFEGTVADNVRTGPRFHGESPDDATVGELLHRVGLSPELSARTAADLSGGERLRLALARALANAPRVLLLDEPTSALDREAAEIILTQLQTIAAGGTALLMVSHREEDATRLGGRRFAMAGGVLREEGARA